MTRRYQKRPQSDTSIKNHHRPFAGLYDVTLAVELTRTVKVKALTEEQAVWFAKNRVRKKSKSLVRMHKAVIGDINLISVQEGSDESTD